VFLLGSLRFLLRFLNCLLDIWRAKITVPYSASHGRHASTKASFKQFSASNSAAKQRSDDRRPFPRSMDEGSSLKENYSKWRHEKGSTKKGNKGGGSMAGGSEERIFRHPSLGMNQSSSDRSRRKVLLRKQVLFRNTSDHLMV
jgi:hypothetical protein